MPSLARLLAASRIALGAASWLAPVHTTRIFGLGSDDPQPVVAQLFGARELALGLVTASAPEADLARVLRVGVAIDGVDVVAAALAARRGGLSSLGMVLTGGGVLAFGVLGVAALAREGRPLVPAA